MKNELHLREIIKLNLIYLIIQLSIVSLSYAGVFSLLTRNCYGSFFCNIDLVMFIQIIIIISFLIYSRTKFILIKAYFPRVFNIFLSSMTLIIFLNIFIYLIVYSPLRLFFEMLTNIFIIILILLVSVNTVKLKLGD